MSPDPSGEPAVSATEPLAGRYRILHPLGSGGMADVYLAEDLTLGRNVAVKVLKQQFAGDPEFVERFRLEAQAAALLSHANIVTVFDRGRAGDSWFIAMEYVGGETLKQRLRREGALEPEEAAATTMAVLAALREAHERHVVHRDVTSHNVLVDPAGRIKVADFGIARIGPSVLTRSGIMLGTTSYISPEQAQGKPADERSDLYSLGVVLFEMLTGRLPFSADSDVALALKHISEEAPDPRGVAADVPEPYCIVVRRALAKDPDRRYQTAADFAAALATAADLVRLEEAAADGYELDGGLTGATVVATAAATVQAAAAPDHAPTPVQAQAVEAPAPPAPPAAPPPDAPTQLAPREAGGAAPGRRPRPVKRRRHLLRWLIVLVVVAAAAGAGWAAYSLVVNGSVKVPPVVGHDETQAVASLRKRDLTWTTHHLYSDLGGAGVVIRQRPRGGVSVKRTTPVDLWVSLGPVHVPAPDVAGLTGAAAADQLQRSGLHVVRRKGASDTVGVGQVVRQYPAAGSTVARGDTVKIWVSTGRTKATVPDVIGLSSGDAGTQLQAAGFASKTDLVAGWGKIPGEVVDQVPAAGTRLRKGSEVVLKVAVF